MHRSHTSDVCQSAQRTLAASPPRKRRESQPYGHESGFSRTAAHLIRRIALISADFAEH